MEIRFRPMTEADIPFGMALKTFAGWNQIETDWRAFLAYEPDGCFVAEADGDRAGTVTTVRFEERVGWIGMVLVHPGWRRRGIGTALLERGIDSLRTRGTSAVKLDATPAGRRVYMKIGFRDEYGLERMEGTAKAIAAPAVESIAAGEVPSLFALDGEAFGVPRHRVLERIGRENPGRTLVARDPRGEPAGYLFVRCGSRAHQIGPWVARDPATAEDLLLAALARLAGEPVFFDVPCVNLHAADLARRHGFTVQRPFTRMYLGANDWPGDPRLVYATSGPEKG